MPTFRYSAYRADGSAAHGTLDAGSLADAQARLKQQGLLVKDLDPDTGKTRAAWRRQRVSVAELALVTRRLATLIGAAVPVHEAVTALHDQERPGELKQLLGRVRERLAEGAGLSRALAAEPAVFGENYVAMVAAGEASGALETVLERLAQFQEDQEALRSTVLTALIYPLLMVVVGGGVMGFLLTFVVPRIVKVFAESKASLPLITVIVMAISNFLQHWWWAVLLVLALTVWGARRLLADTGRQLQRDRLLLRLPYVGPLVQRLATHLPASGCVATQNLTRSQLAALEVHGTWRLSLDPRSTDCRWLLVGHKERLHTPVALQQTPAMPGWTLVARERRPSDRDEVMLVYRRP